MNSIDIKKQYKDHYEASSKRVSFVEIEKVRYLMIDGNGNPEVEEFRLKIDALRSFVKEFKEHFKAKDISYATPPIEGLWDTYDNKHFDVTRKEKINFTLLIPLVDEISEDVLAVIKDKLLFKSENPYIIDIYCREFEEGHCVQMLHKGPYNTEINTTTMLMEYITIGNFKLKGMHHEIYMNNPDKVTKEDLKTIVRYAIEDA